MVDRSKDRAAVLMVPDYTSSNPYQQALIDGLPIDSDRVRTASPRIPGGLLREQARTGAPIVHLNWVHRFFAPNRRFAAPLTAVLGCVFLLEVMLVRLRGATVLWTVHNVVHHEARAPRTEQAIRAVLARIVDGLIVHCDAARSILAAEYRLPGRVEDRVQVIPHGHYIGLYPDDISDHAARQELGLDADELVFVYFGLIRAYKNVPAFLETFTELDIEATVVVAGRPWTDELEEQVRDIAETDPRIDVSLEFVPDDQVQTYFHAADAVVYPFSTVLTSGSTILAMSFGRAVVAPSVGCIPRLIEGGGGFTYDQQNAAGLRTALVAAAESRERLQRMGERNRRVVSQFSWSRIGARTVQAYHVAAGTATS